MEIKIKAESHPTEDPERVRTSILNLFPDAAELANAEPERIKMLAADIGPFLIRISEQKIRDTARNILLKSIRGKYIRFRLNKQAAFSNRVNFAEGEQVLGCLEISIMAEDPEKFINDMLGVAK
jgi:hypothetical protein